MLHGLYFILIDVSFLQSNIPELYNLDVYFARRLTLKYTGSSLWVFLLPYFIESGHWTHPTQFLSLALGSKDSGQSNFQHLPTENLFNH